MYVLLLRIDLYTPVCVCFSAFDRQQQSAFSILNQIRQIELNGIFFPMKIPQNMLVLTPGMHPCTNFLPAAADHRANAVFAHFRETKQLTTAEPNTLTSRDYVTCKNVVVRNEMKESTPGGSSKIVICHVSCMTARQLRVTGTYIIFQCHCRTTGGDLRTDARHAADEK
jgi:hypothetical protein